MASFAIDGCGVVRIWIISPDNRVNMFLFLLPLRNPNISSAGFTWLFIACHLFYLMCFSLCLVLSTLCWNFFWCIIGGVHWNYATYLPITAIQQHHSIHISNTERGAIQEGGREEKKESTPLPHLMLLSTPEHWWILSIGSFSLYNSGVEFSRS